MPDERTMKLYEQMDPPFVSFSRSDLGGRFAEELDTVSRMWFACGYRPGIGAYLNFFFLSDFIELHDLAFPARFATFREMARSFYRTDLFVRDVTDSGARPTGGISSAHVRAMLEAIMNRHRRISIPPWMMTHFGFSLAENVEKQVEGFTDRERQMHLDYMHRTYRIMGLRFSRDRGLMEEYSRRIDAAHCGPSPNLVKHARNILVIGEMVGVSSRRETIAAMLPEPTREEFRRLYLRMRPHIVRRLAARLLGRLLMKRAVGTPRRAVPVTE